VAIRDKIFKKLQDAAEIADNNAKALIKDDDARSEIVELVVKRWEQSKNDRSYLDLVWQQAYSYYSGQQNVTIDETGVTLIPLRDQRQYDRMDVNNMIQPIIATKLSLLNRYSLEPRVIPVGDDEDDRAKALACTKLLKFIMKGQAMPDKMLTAYLYAEVFGSAIFKTYWDANAGNIVAEVEVPRPDHEGNEDPTDNYEPNKADGGSPKKWTVPLKEGAPVIEVISPWEIYPEQVQKPLREQRWIIHSILMSSQDVYEKYGVWIEGTTNQTLRLIAGKEQFLYQLGGNEVGLSSIPNSVRIYEMWEIPSPQYPEGRLVTIADKTLLHYGAMPYKAEDGTPCHPFDVYMAQFSDGFFGDSIVRQLIPLQDSLNDCSNKIMDYVDRVCVGSWLAPEGSALSLEGIMDDGIQSGTWIQYKQGLDQPHQVQNVSLPGEIFSMKRTLVEDMQRISGLNELTMTASSSPYASGSMLQELAKAADTRIGAQYTRGQVITTQYGSKCLSLCKQWMVGPRFYQILDIKGEALETGSISLDDIASTEVTVDDQPESTLVARQQNMATLIQYGVFQPGAFSASALELIFGLYEIGNGEEALKYINEVREQEKQAQQQQAQAGVAE
jgi:hypothetical protein